MPAPSPSPTPASTWSSPPRSTSTSTTSWARWRRAYDRNTYSANLIDIVRAFVPGRQGVTEAEATAWADDLTGLGRAFFFSLNRYVFTAVKAGAGV